MHNTGDDSMNEKLDGVAGSTRDVMDGSGILELFENEKVFSNFADHKFQELDTDCNGKLSLEKLQPAVKVIGAALGLPAQGASPQSDQIYTEVLNEFTNGKQEEISMTEFREVLSDFLIGMAAGLKRDPVLILRIDGEDLREFLNSPNLEQEMISIFAQINDELPDGSLKVYLIKAFEKLTVDHGMPPATDPWVISNILEPALESDEGENESRVSQEMFLAKFRKTAEAVVRILDEQPSIVAHSQNTFDGRSARSLVSNKFKLKKALDSAIEAIPREDDSKLSKEYLGVALDSVATAAGLPPCGAADQMDSILTGALKMSDTGIEQTVNEDEFKKLLTEILGRIMLQLEDSPVTVSVNHVVHEQLLPSPTLLQPSSP